MRLTLTLVVLTVFAAACSASVHVPILSVSSPGGGLSVVFDHPCPEGGLLSVEVEETETNVVITATKTDFQVVDCDGGAGSSDVLTLGIELDSALRDRIVVDGSTGDIVPVDG